MKQSAVRILCACLLMCLALGIAVASIGAVVDEQESPAPKKVPAPNETVSLFSRVALRSAKPGEKIFLYGADGKLLQTLLTDTQANAATKLLQAGQYYVCTENGCTAFTLAESAALTISGGCGWTDGERLHLEQGLVGTVRVEQTVTRTAAEVGWLDFVLTDGEYRRREVVFCEAEGEMLTCSFEGVPYGDYRMEESGKLIGKVTVNAETPLVTISASQRVSAH